MNGTHQPHPPNSDTIALIEAAKGGDQSAYAALYDQFAPGVYRLAYSILLHKHDAEDVMQESMVYAFRALPDYDYRRAGFRTWLYHITVSRCRNARRRKWLPTVRLSHLLSLGLEPAGDDSPDADAEWSNARETLARAFARLSPRLREALALRYGKDLTYREMADILGCPQKTAESRVRLAHQALRAGLSEADAALLEQFAY
ncbi:MAG TPA: RNA polymerase sigma factor [Aggregatilineales bacterium]|nr:RNA polymerase sigma factor [Anaerolineales bacterium]HRE48712.1 RNA polymerase sigma factor [Aggregatilineales bacterium]